MKLKSIICALTGLAMTTAFSSCEDEKDLIIIEGNLPIKTSTLYMVGDATPNGWNIDMPTPLVASDADPLVFEWEGELNTGEMKLCLTTGSWDAPFIRPKDNGIRIGKSAITDAVFDMHAGNPDNKWRISDAGVYHLTFNLRNWTMSTSYLREAEGPEIEPIETETLYLVGDASPLNTWEIDNPTPVEKKSQYEFVYEGPLYAGELKACISTGDWDASFIRPATADVKINENGIENNQFIFSVAPDNKWIVETPGIYRLSFNLKDWTIAVEYTGEFTPASKLYMIGQATKGGWSWDDATEIVADADNDNLFVWEGELARGTFKAARKKDFEAPFYRPASAGCTVSEAGVSAREMVFTTEPDDQWEVTVAGNYRLTFDTEAMTFDAVYLSGDVQAKPLYMIGTATRGGWSLDDATEIAADAANSKLYVWEGDLTTGTFKAALEKNFEAPFYRPASAGCTVSEAGVSAHGMVFTTEPDDQWEVTVAGKYRLTFDTEAMTFDAVYLNGEVQAQSLYMIGTATRGGWSLDAATEITADASNSKLYVWEGDLTTGTFKAALEKSFDAPFYRPASAGCTVSEAGVSAREMVFTTEPDDQWEVTVAGKYRLTFDTDAMTFDAVYLSSEIQAKPLYMIGSATKGGWSLDEATELTAEAGQKDVYTWTGTLKKGEFKFTFEKDFGASFYRPSSENCTVSASGVSATDMIYRAGDPDYKWNVIDEGTYTLTVDTKNMTINITYKN